MKALQDRIRKFITGGDYTDTSIVYDKDKIKIRLFRKSSREKFIFIIINAPWRITRKGKFINSSAFFPEEQGVAFQHFNESTDALSKEKIIDVEIRPGSNDLIIKWESGALLESFNMESEQHCCNVNIGAQKISFDVSYGKISEWK